MCFVFLGQSFAVGSSQPSSLNRIGAGHFARCRSICSAQAPKSDQRNGCRIRKASWRSRYLNDSSILRAWLPKVAWSFAASTRQHSHHLGALA
eukprot:3317345-Prymnesium_polylepis.1